MRLYRELLDNPPEAPDYPPKTSHRDSYKTENRNIVSVVRSDDRSTGILQALELLGGLEPVSEGVDGEILIKPNCNTDDPYPRDTHHDTVRVIAQSLIDAGVEPRQIVVGDMSGRGRGLPTRVTMENLGIQHVADELGLQVAYFEEEDWVMVIPDGSTAWPHGIRIPKRVYEADRIILSPILRSHSTATFTVGMKLGVGLIDAMGREWLHNGEDFYRKMIEINLAFQADIIVADAMKMNTGPRTYPKDEVEPGIIIASNNIVSSDAASVALMKYYNTYRVKDIDIREHEQFTLARELGLGSSDPDQMIIKSKDLAGDPIFNEIVRYIKTALGE